MNKKWLFSFLIAFLSLSCANQGVKDRVLLLKDVRYSPNADIPHAVRLECDLPGKLAQYIKKSAVEGSYRSIIDQSPIGSMQADTLTIEIIKVEGAPGGVWTGSKSVAIKATLSKPGQEKLSFSAARYPTAGSWSTCSLLHKCVRTLGSDVANWLENPRPNAVLK